MTSATAVNGEIVPIDSLTPFPGNARRGDMDKITDSLRRRGQYKPLTVSSDSVILGGNHTWLGMKDLGFTEAKIWRLPIKGDSTEAEEINVADNATADGGTYDPALLVAQLQRIPNFAEAGIGLGLTDMQALLKAIEPPKIKDVEDVPDVDEKTVISEPEDVYYFGPDGKFGMLFVGSGAAWTEWTKADALVTDPPYGMAFQSNYGKVKKAKIEGDGDTLIRDTVLNLWAPQDTRPRTAAVFGTWKAPRPDARFIEQFLIWDKTDGTGPGMGNLKQVFGTSHEDIYLSGDWTINAGDARRGSVLRTAVSQSKAAKDTGHPTPKPIELLRQLTSVLPGGITLADPFAGSGSLLIAGYLTGHPVIMCELYPPYADVICRRWVQQTGTNPIRNRQGLVTEVTDFDEFADLNTPAA